jgi:hypothetical protein
VVLGLHATREMVMNLWKEAEPLGMTNETNETN